MTEKINSRSGGAVPSGLQRLRGARGLLAAVLVVLATACWLVPGASAQASMVEENALSGLSAMTQASAYDAPRGLIHFGLTNTSSFEYVTLNSTSWELVEYKEVDNSEAVTALWVDGDDLFIASDQGNNAVSFVTRFNVATQLPKKVLLPFGLRPRNMYITGGRLYLGCQGTTGLGHYIRMTANFDTSDIPSTFEEIPDIKAPPNKVDFDTASNFLYYTIDEARSFARISTDTWDVVTHYEEYIGIFSCINVEPGAFLYLTTVLSDSASIVFQLDITDPELGLETLLFLTEATYASSLDTDYNYLYFATFPVGKVHKVLTTDMTLYDTVSTSTLGWTSAAFDPVNKVMFLHDSASNATKFSVENCASQLSCGPCAALDDYCGWCYSDDACALADQCAEAATFHPASCPAVADISPLSGSIAGGTALTVTGTDFRNDSRIDCDFGVAGVVEAIFDSPTQIRCYSPPIGAEGNVDVTLVFDGQPYAGPAFNFLFYDCSLPTTCSTCVDVLRPECAWCVLTSNCSTTASCPVTNIDDAAECPVINSRSPESGALEGGYELTIFGAQADTWASVPLTCVFNGAVSVPATGSGFSIKCVVPNRLTPGSVLVEVYNGAVPYTDSTTTFTYYDCAAVSCDTCHSAARPMCGWCRINNNCTISSACGPTFADEATECPALTSINPSRGSIEGGTEVLVTGSNFVNPGNVIKCRFGTFDVTPTFLTGTQQYSCVTPAQAGPLVSFSLVHEGNAWAPPTTLPFTYYDCANSGDCDTCLNATTQPECGWCIFDNACTTSLSCANATYDVFTSSCPTLNAVAPTSGPSDGAITPGFLTLTGSEFYDSPDNALACRFGGSTITAATVVTAASVECNLPSFATGATTLELYNTRLNQPYVVGSIPFEFYSCAWDCATCITSQYAACGWCPDDAACTVKSNCSSQTRWRDAQCPAFTAVAPVNGSTAGNTLVVVEGALFLAGLDLDCRFDATPQEGTRQTDTELRCSSPPAGAAGTVAVEVLLNGAPYVTDTRSYDYYDCSLQTSCETCYHPDRKECGWCLQESRCLAEAQCTDVIDWFDSTASCAAVLSASPDRGPIEGGTTVTVVGSQFRDVGLQCRFDGTDKVLAVVVNETHLTCVAPLASGGGGSVALEVLNSDDTLYSSDSTTFIYYNCGLQTACATCFDADARPECGWCRGEGACTIASECSPIGTFDATCPTLVGISPSSGAIDGGTLVNVTGTLFTPSINIQCDFDVGASTNATFVSSTLLQCYSPPTASPNVETFTLLDTTNAIAFSPGFFDSYNYYDCGESSSCDSCTTTSVTKPECGWCVNNQACQISSDCGAGVWSSSDCPQLYGLFPASGAVDGGTVIEISGDFIDGVAYECVVGPSTAPAVFNNVTGNITCVAPFQGADGPQQLTVEYQGTSVAFADNSLTFNYYDCADGIDCGSCITPARPECGFCLGNSLCTINSNCAALDWSPQVCPALDAFLPATGGAIDGGTNVTVVGQAFTDVIPLACRFNMTGGPFFQPATFVDDNTLKCVSPVAIAAEVANLDIWKADMSGDYAPASPSRPFTFYNCSAGYVSPSCGTCIQLTKPECGHCDTTSCTIEQACSAGVWAGECASIQGIVPDRGALDGGTVVDIAVDTIFQDGPNYTCQFGALSVPANVAVWAGGTNVTCTAPDQLGTLVGDATVAFAIFSNSNPFTQFVDFDYYSCDVNCAACTDPTRSECGWCYADDQCSILSVCSSAPSWEENPANCAALTSVLPTNGATAGNTAVYVTGSNFNFNNGTLSCFFGGVEVDASVVNDTHITCTTPVNAAGPAALVVADRDTDRPFADDTLSFDYYDCGDHINCGVCTAAAAADENECVWCRDTSTCVVSSQCGAGEFTQSTCSEVSTVAPTQGSTEGSTLLTVVGTFFVDVPGLKCRFDKSGLIDQDATFVSDTELQCLSPPAGTDGAATLSIRNGALPYATDTVTYEYYDCGDFTLCSPCSSAATYPECGWCLATATCNTNSSCSTAWANEATGCPSFLAIDPDAGSTGGGTAVNVTGTFFEAGLQCSFGGDTAPATLVSPSLLQCDSTPKAAGPYSVDILTAGGDPFVDTSETFTYYDCSLASDCGTCINPAQPECGWCATTSECTTNCPLPAAFVREVGSCPAIASVLPAAGSRTGGTPVTVSGTSFFNTANLRCEFGTKITAVTVVNDTTLTCTAPSGVAAAPVAFRLRNGGVGEYYSTSVDTFTYYDCPAVTDCATCDSGVRAECGWCLETSTCVVQSNCPNVLYWGQGACPTFDAIAPTEGSTDGGTVILVTGTLFIDESIIECEFNGIRRPATFINETAVQCVTPDSAEGNSVVRLRNGALTYAPETQNFDYYDCNVDCSDCFVTGSECGWCGDSNECTINGICANFWQQVECPARAGVAPINGAINGGTVVTISGAQFIDSPSLKCKFGNQVVNTSFVSAAEVRCASPPALVGGASLSLQNNGEPFTDDPPQTFTYYDCAAGLDCESCNTTRPECGWCVDDSACVVEASCDGGGLWVQDFGSCPTLSTVLPVNGSIDGGTTVTVSGVGFLAGVAYECDFGGQVTSATYQSPVAVTCVSPPQATPGSKALRVRNADGSAYYTSDTLAFLYYDCDVGCGSCFDNKPECGWCNSQKACTVRDNCAVTANWQRDECPAQFDITPSRGAINGGTSVVVTGLQFFDGLKCRFGDGMAGIVDATIMDQTTAVCVTPPTISATAVNFDLILNGTTISFTDDNLVFEYYDCLALATCGVCYSELLGDREECGWCLDSNDCRVSADCPGTGAYWTQAGCPALTSITPNSGSLLGGTNVTITGQQFIDNPFFRVQFGPTPVTPTIVSPTLAFAEAPSSASVATISVSLSQRSELFAPEIKTYSYYDCANDGQVAAVTCDGTPTSRACATIGSECGWCPASTGCTTASICGSTWTRNCPSADFVFPVTGASDGGTFVTVLGEEFVGSLSLQCRFEENDGSSFIDVPATAADANTLNCITPPHGFGGLKLQVYHSGVQYTPDVLPFQYYECGDKACDLCQQDFFPECGWCQTNNTCSVARKCDAAEYLDTECPLLTAANPATGSIQGGTAVTITGAFFNPAIPLQCLFGSTLVNATYVNPGRIECVSPPNAAGSATLGIVNALNGGAYVNAATQYTTFEYYDCAAPDCATCLNPARTECVWCTVDSQCTSSQFCVDPSNRVPLGTPCPAIDTLEPSSGAIEGGTLLTFTAAPGHLHANLALECHWWATVVESYNVSTVYNATVDQTVLVNVTVGNTTVLQNSTIQVLEERTNVTTFFNSTLASWRAPAVRTTNDVATCVAPPSILLNGGPGVANLTLEHANFSVFGAPFEYTYYDCSAWSSDCDACLAPDRRDCGWCLSSYACTVDCGVNNWANDACPALLFATPPSADLNPVDVVITGTIFNPALAHDCVFDVGGLEVTSPATVTSTTELSCVSPDNSFGVTDNGTLDVRMGGRDYTPDVLDFDFYDCSAAPDCATCVDPVAHPSCGWCYASDSCSIASQCATPAFAPTCPAVTDTSAGAFEVMTGAGINITGTAFVEAPNIECVWNSTSAGTVTSAALFLASDGVWWCGAPAELTVSETVTVRLAVDNGDFYAYGSAEVDAFDCVSAAMCDDCTSQYCEFCPYDNMCVRGGTCVRPADYVLSASEEADPPEDWVECPAVYEVTPSEGRTSEPSLVTVSGVSLVHSSSSVTVECQWGNQATEATTLTPTVINCNTPVIDFDDQVGGGGTAGRRRLLQQDYEEGDTVNYPFRVLVNGRPYAAAAAAFSFTVDAEAAIPTDEGSGFPVWVIIAAVAALLLILCAIAIMMAVRNREPELKPPNFVPLIFGAQLRPLIEGPVPRLEVLERLLLEGDMAFVFALCDATAITEADKVCQALIYIFEERDRAIRLVNAFVTREIENSIRTSTLFRSNSFASKLFKHYSKLLGLPYLFQTLAFNVHDVCETYSGENDEQGTIELDPTKQGQGDNAGLNKFTLLLSCQKTLVEITRSVDNLPYNLRSIVAHVAQDVEAKFPDAVHIAIGGFMILRFVCPAITAPEAYGILREPPSVNARRHLVLIAKVLQNLANGVLFGKKERFMEQTNDFIKTNLPEIRAFFDEVATLPQNITPPPHADIPKNVKDNALAFIHNHMLTYMRKVNEEVDHLPSPQAKALKVWITSVLNEVGPGPIQLARAR